jgi:CelD/BcsL family acetyltransferase involved in cellulose biosynthesis
MDRKDKKDIRRQIHRLEREGIISIQEIKEPRDIEQGLHIFYDIEDSGWKGKEGTSLKRSYYGEYYRELALHFSGRNKFRLYLLKLNNKNIAGIYAIIDQGIFYIVKTGYSEDYSQYSPSKVLCFLLFEQLFKDETIQKIDFYGPFLNYEKTFGKNTRIRYKVTIVNRKIIPTFYFVFLQILRILKYPFPEHSLRGKFVRKLKKYMKI